LEFSPVYVPCSFCFPNKQPYNFTFSLRSVLCMWVRAITKTMTKPASNAALLQDDSWQKFDWLTMFSLSETII
ncbi:hypothetical protein ILYODFUR_026199, partial [Ilyodon furcidens]